MYEHCKKMTIDLGQTTLTLYLDGILPTNAGVRVSLRSNYSNEYLWQNVTAADTIYDEWYELEISNADYTNIGVAGYYTLTVEYLGDDWTVFDQYLVKALNTADGNDTPDAYLSDNEDNEQVTFYKG